MQTKKIRTLLLISILLINCFAIFAATKQDKTDCKTTTFTQGLCNITQTVCVTFQDRKNQDGIYDYVIVWEKVAWDCGIASKGSKSGNTYEGEFKFRDTNNTGYFNDNPLFDPSDDDSLVSFVATPAFDPSNPEATFLHTTFEIAYRDRNTSSLTGVFSKEANDIEPLYISHKQIGPAKMNGTWNTEIFEQLATELIDLFADITPRIYPNPTNGIITIELKETVRMFLVNYTEVRKFDNLKIINTKGETVYEASNIEIANPYTIDISNLPSGTYFVNLIIGNSKGDASFILNK